MTEKALALPQGQEKTLKKKLCGAHTHAGGICKNPAMPNGRCRFHGGMSLKGAAHPGFKHGNRSKYMPARLLDQYKESLKDPGQLELTSEIAIIDARLSELLGRVDTKEAGEHWKAARKAYDDLRRASARGDVIEIRTAMESLDRAIGKGIGDYAAWNEVLSCIDHRRKLVESQRKRLIEQNQILTKEQAMMLIVALQDSVRRNVTDPLQLRAISEDVARIITVGGALAR